MALPITLVNLITVTDFQEHPFKILVGKNMPEIKLTNEITKRQKEILIRILGYQEYHNLANDNAGNFPNTQKWIDFINGIAYEKDAKFIDYEGVKQVIKLYTYYWYTRNNIIQPGNMGGQKLELQHAFQKTETDKCKNAINEMVYLIGYTNNYIPTVFNYLNDHDFDAKIDIDIITKINDVL